MLKEFAMFVGRDAELKSLENLYGKEGFQMLVLYGRRRIGKTALLSHFCKGKRTLFFTAEQKNDTDNLRSFSASSGRFSGNATTTQPSTHGQTL